MTGRDSAKVWVLIGPHKGDNNQLLALAQALGLPFRTIQMRYRWWAHLPALLRSHSIAQLELAARAEIVPPWPSLVLGIGQRSAPVARYIQRVSGGRTKIVRLGDPMVPPQLFDLVITTTQYAVRDASNVIRLPMTITSGNDTHPTRDEYQRLNKFARPRRLMVIGGRTSLWHVDDEVVIKAARALQQRAEVEGGSVIAVTSPRTNASLANAARSLLGCDGVISGPFPRYTALLKIADEVHVTGDSVSMLSDAVASGKPVGLIPLEPNAAAKLVRFAAHLRGRQFRIRDLRRFWDDLSARGLVGTVEQPRCGTLEVSPIETAVAAIRDTMNKQEVLGMTARSVATAPALPEPLAL